MDLATARKTVGQRLDLPAFETPADLSPQDRETLYDGLAEFIIENWSEFGRRERDWAGRRIDSPFFKEPLEEYTAADAVKSFGGEFAKRGKEILTFKNPLVRYAVIGGALGLGLYFAFKADKARHVITGRAR